MEIMAEDMFVLDTSDGFVADTSFAQQSMWLLHQIDPGKPTYNVISATRIRGRLDADALRRALNAVVNRHETLRTVFRLEGDLPVQVVAPSAHVPLTVNDVHPSEVDDWVRREVETPFDLEHGPLIRMRLLDVGPEEYVLVLVMHHIITDGWSSAIVFRELSHYYQGFAGGTSVELPELPVQYADYSVWQRKTLTGDRLERLLDYWTDRLAGVDPLRLPADRPRPAVRSSRGQTIRFPVSADLMAAVESLGRQHRATPFMVLLAALTTLFSRRSGQLDITMSTAVANRDRAEISGLIGYFVNTLPLRTDLSGDPTVAELVDRVRENCREAYGHQEMPFDKVVEAVAPERDGGIGNALVRAMLVLQNTPTEPWRSGELTFEPMSLDNRTALLDLSVMIEAVASGGYVCVIEYSADLFDRPTIERFGASYVQLLEAFVADPTAHVERIELSGERAWGSVVAEWNATERTLPDVPVHELITEQAARTPAAVAVECGDVRLTYAELDHRSTELSLLLRGFSADVVALALPASTELAVAVLGVLKSGAACLFLDPHTPPARLTETMRNARPSVVLTGTAFESRLTGAAGDARVICLDQDWPAVRGSRISVHPAGPACVFYTSGSTNVPKGVLFGHRGLTNFTLGVAEAFDLTAADRYLQLSATSFDVVLEELLPAWVVGATAVLPTERILATGADLTDWVTRLGITVVDLTPVYWHEWVHQLAERGGAPETLRLAVVGGDRVLANAVETWQDFGVDLIEVYGQTEAVVTSTTCRLTERGTTGRGPGFVVGRPIANTRLYVLDHLLRPVPPGASGEIYLAGSGLALGYLNQPTETTLRFVADPFGPPGSRMLRTGDLGRRRPDAEVEFVGRVDDQLKVRGHRVEPTEIEAVLVRHPAVTRAVVLPHGEGGARHLMAYAAGEVEPDVLRDFLAERLPDFMVPAAVAVLPTLPLSTNGKVDRQALLATAAARRPTSRPAATPEEDVLTGLVAELLGLQEVGADDDFFAIGGDSIRAIQLAARARSAGVTISPRDVFTRRTAARMVVVAGEQRVTVGADPDAGIGAVPATPATRWLDELGRRTDRFSQAVLLRVPALREEWLVEAVLAVLDNHDALRMRAERAGQVVMPRGSVDAASVVSRCTGDEPVAKIAERARNELDPGAGVMMRVVWLDTSDRLLVVLHHLVADALSLRIVVSGLAMACQQVSAGGPAELVAEGTSFRQWAIGLPAAASEPSRASELTFWRQAVRTPDPLLGDRKLDSGVDLAGTARSRMTSLPAEVAGPLLTDVPAVFHTGAVDALLAGLAMAVGRRRRRGGGNQGTSVQVDLQGHGREEQLVPGADLSRTVGWFGTMYPVTLDPGDVPWTSPSAVGAALNRVKEQLRAVPGNGIGFGLLRYLAPDGASLAMPAPQIGFNYLGRLETADPVSGWALDPGTESLGSGYDPDMPLPHALEISAVAHEEADGLTLSVHWLWAPGVLSEKDVQGLEEDWFAALAALAGSTGGGLTPSDLPLMSLSQAEIDELQAEFGDA